MKKIFIHAGFAKCASTSLQVFMSKQSQILYPESGINGAEHLSLPLKINGIDEYTSQYFNQEWVENSHERMLIEIKNASQQVIFVSSERLADLSFSQLLELKNLFSDDVVEIILIKRPVEDFFDSTWRHMVFFHDYGNSMDVFLDSRRGFDFEHCIDKFRSLFTVHVFELNDPQFLSSLSALLGVEISLGRSNVGIKRDFACFLQQLHQKLGTTVYTSVFTSELKFALRDSISQPKDGLGSIDDGSNHYPFNSDDFKDFACILSFLRQCLGAEKFKHFFGYDALLILLDAWNSPTEVRECIFE